MKIALCISGQPRLVSTGFLTQNKYILERREGEVQREIATINNRIAGRTKKEWREDNRDKLSEYHKQYHQDNRDKHIELFKQYRQNNRDKILENRKQKITCERCGSLTNKHHISRHQQSKKCLNYNVGNN